MTAPVIIAGDLVELLERLKAATGPDRELDFRIHIAVVEDVIWPVRDKLGRVTNPNYRMTDYLNDFAGVINSDDQDFDFPRYTASIDAAWALIERALPEANCWGVEKEPNYIEAYVSRNNVKSGHWIKTGTAATPALALCAAFLSARSSLDQDGGKP